MRKFFCVSVLIFIIAFSAPAFSSVRNFGRINIEVPKGWNVARDRDGSTIILRSLNSGSIVRLKLSKLDGEPFERLARNICASHDGTDFKFNHKGNVTFTYKNIDDEECTAMVSSNEEFYMFLSASGKKEELDEVIHSLKWNEDSKK